MFLDGPSCEGALERGDEMSGRIESVSQYDRQRLTTEVEAYQLWLDSKTQEAYDIARIAKAKGLDFSTEIEIPRASDLASRTEKLLEEYLVYYQLMTIQDQ